MPKLAAMIVTPALSSSDVFNAAYADKRKMSSRGMTFSQWLIVAAGTVYANGEPDRCGEIRLVFMRGR
jgi:hypothetical protein